jgi:soluble P-type ATPase
MFLSFDGALAGVIAVGDRIKDSTPAALAALKSDNLRLVMLTGDAHATAEWVGRQLGLDEVISEVQPAAKAQVIERLQKEGRRVAMAGDGINDAPALALADVGIAMGTGTDIAMESAQVTLEMASSSGPPIAIVASVKRFGNLGVRPTRRHACGMVLAWLFLFTQMATATVPGCEVGVRGCSGVETADSEAAMARMMHSRAPGLEHAAGRMLPKQQECHKSCAWDCCLGIHGCHSGAIAFASARTSIAPQDGIPRFRGVLRPTTSVNGSIPAPTLRWRQRVDQI